MQKFTPYPELKLTKNGDDVTLETPWLRLSCEVDARGQAILPLILKELCAYPICYIHPRKPKLHDLWRVLGSLGKRERSEDLNQVMRFSRIGLLPIFDKIAAFSVLRRMLHQSLLDQGERELNNRLEALKADPERFQWVIGVYVFQNYFITYKCQEALAPALQSFPEIRDRVQRYMNAESGHDKLTKKSLMDLGFTEPTELPLLPETQELMDILKQSAETSSVAFAMMIEFFESGSGTKVHPVARLLTGTPYEKAGAPLQRHRDINTSESHASAAMSFLLGSDSCAAWELRLAQELSERAVAVKHRLIMKMIAIAEEARDCNGSDFELVALGR